MYYGEYMSDFEVILRYGRVSRCLVKINLFHFPCSGPLEVRDISLLRARSMSELFSECNDEISESISGLRKDDNSVRTLLRIIGVPTWKNL